MPGALDSDRSDGWLKAGGTRLGGLIMALRPLRVVGLAWNNQRTT
ncbi:MAG TPA: hypothetical protein VG077_07065 [Verrucomicrobiae bacterium]|nr:hypothetical protein [Verrucomicrobiae bacterium]